MNVTKQQMDAMAMGITFHGSKPSNPQLGDVYVDSNTYYSYMYTGSSWMAYSGPEKIEPPFTPPTEEQLEKHPALKAAWDEFMVLKKLLGL